MPITFRKSWRILPGIRLNLNRKSWSITIGPKNGPSAPGPQPAASPPRLISPGRSATGTPDAGGDRAEPAEALPKIGRASLTFRPD